MQPRGGGDRMVRKGPWTAEEDEVLLQHVREHGPREWSSIRSKGLLPRTGKSCRLRWVNKLRPNLKTGCKFSPEEERVVIDLQAQFGNKWAKIATYLPGRTDNDVKNFWSTRQKRLARILRAPLPRRKSGKQNNGSAATAPSHVLPTSKDPWPGMNPFQETMHNIGQSSQEACMENQCADAPFPAGLLDPESILPSSIEFAVDAAAECSSYNAAPAAYLSFGDAGDPASVVDPAVFVDVASADSNVAYLYPIPEVQPAQFLGLEEDDYGHVAPVHQDMSDVMFDDLPPDMFDFLELPPSPPPLPPPPTSPSTHL